MKTTDYWKDTNMTAVSTSWATSEHTNGARSYLRHPLSHIAKRKSPEPATGKVGRSYVRVQSAMLCQALIYVIYMQFLGVSIWMFKDDIKSGLNAVRQPKATAAAAARRSSIWIPILMM